MTKRSKVRLRAGASIGEPAAEDDAKFLSECFVSHPAVEALKDIDSSQCIALGRTGVGKSALLLHLEETLQNTSRVDPQDVAFTYVGNSSIIRHVSELGVDLHTLYEYLWTHIITLHITKNLLGVESPDRMKRIIRLIEGMMKRNPKREIALNYLEKNADQFWLTVEQVTTEVADSLSGSLAAHAGVGTAALNAKIEAGEKWTENMRRSFKHRAQGVVSNLQMRELKETINALADCLDSNTNYYILIDDLDREWAGNDATQYALIRALIECLKTFRRIPNLKIIIAMREDLFEATLRSNTDKHFQSEKLEGIVRRLRWTDDLLTQLVDRRLRQLFRHAYTKKNVSMNNIFPETIAQRPARRYLLDRTLRRPRDIIAFVNKVLVMNEGQQLPLTSRSVTQAEASYSNDRIRAMVDEWRSCHPLVEHYIRTLTGLGIPARVSDIDESRLTDLVLEVETLDREVLDDVEKFAKLVYRRNKGLRLEKLAREVVVELYKFGVLSLKLGAGQPFLFSYEQRATVAQSEITNDVRLVVHPMFRAALGCHAQLEKAA